MEASPPKDLSNWTIHFLDGFYYSYYTDSNLNIFQMSCKMNHRIAILSDIHGDTTALEAVIADARAQGATEYWLRGTFCFRGLEEMTF